MEKWLHSTSKINAKSIVESGFKIPKESGRFGRGVYFMNDLSFGYFGDTVISVKVKCPVFRLTHSEICDIYSEYDLEPEEEGVVELEDYTKEKGFNAVEVIYKDGTSELVVYDVKCISDICIVK